MLTRYSSCISLFADGSRSNSIGSSALKRSILSQLTSQDKGVGLTGIPSPPNLPNLQATSFDYRLERLLEEIENQSLRALRQQRKSAIIRGQKNVVTRDLPLYQRALERHGFQVHGPPWYRKHRLADKNSTVYFIMDSKCIDITHPEH
ncbi:uncharacterized protein TNCV_4944961 [Trichonephila clavipes]|nr:uncharacterized protein TNCV_4944961 [Trichonephila clavipes]